MKLPVHSIRWRIQAWHGLLLLLVLAGFGATAYRLQSTNEFRHLDEELQLRTHALHGSLVHPPRNELPPLPDEGEEALESRPPQPGAFQLPRELADLFAAHNGTMFYYRIWTRTGAVFGESANAPSGIPLPARTQGVSFRSREGMREVYDFTPPGECLLVGVSEAVHQHEMAQFAGWLIFAGAVVLILGLTGGWWLVSRAIAPIDDISAAAMRIADGHFDERIEVVGIGGELDQLAGVLNETFARLEAAFAEQARFTSDAAHELRTPISIILAQTQFALARPRNTEAYRETIEITRRSAVRMQGLIESLLTLARLDAHSEPLQRQPCDLSELAREQLDHIRPLATERGILLQGDFAPAPCDADPGFLAQIFTNLLSNAVKYSRAGGEVRLSASRVNGHAIASISDNGPGIAAEHLPHLFERFYRADASRNRTTGGAGLGLAICKTLAEAHGGTLEVTSVQDHGSTFTLRIPCAVRDDQPNNSG